MSKQLLSLVKVNLKSRYRGTWIGFIWVLLNPILIYIVQAIIFSGLFKNSPKDYLLYLLTGLFPWFFLTQSAEMSCSYLKSNASLIQNLKLSPFFLISSLVIENFLNFIFSSMIVFVGLFIFFNVAVTSALLFYLVSLFFFIFVLCISFLLSYAHTLFKDVKYVSHFLFTLFYFLTPTFYFLSSVPENVQSLIKWNPLFWILNIYRLYFFSVSGITFFESAFYFIFILLMTAAFTFYFAKKMHNKIYLRL